MFRRFIASVPAVASNTDEARFLPPARQLCTYLERILQHLSSHHADADACMAAGMYAITAFFLQNSASCVPRFYGPPPQYDPVYIDEAASVTPAAAASPTETEELAANFFEIIRKKFPQENKQNEPDNSGSQDSDSIAPAAVRMEFRHDSHSFTVVDTENVNTKAFIIDNILTFEDQQWRWRCSIRELPYEEKIIDTSSHSRTFQIASHHYSMADYSGLLLTARDDNKTAMMHSFLIDQKKMYVSEKPACISGVEIDENGFLVDRELEQILSFCRLKTPLPDASAQPVTWKKASSDFDPAYLQYLIVDAQTMKTLPMTVSRNPSNGKYQVQAVLPCPGYLLILEVSTNTGVHDADLLTGYMHGVYGLIKNMQKAEKLMRDGAERNDPRMAFEYGAFLLQSNQTDQAEKHLRFAADNNIPGAQVELAQLLKNRGSANDLAESRALLNSLLSQGYRTYGSTPIDLFHHHPNDE